MGKNTKLPYIYITIATSILIIIGFPISEKITNNYSDIAQSYNKSVKIKDKDTFDYSIDTDQGDMLVNTKIKAVDPVKFDEMNKEFTYVEKIKEKYTRHVKHIPAVKDSDGDIITPARTKVYWSWDYSSKDVVKSKEISIFDNTYNINNFHIGNTHLIYADKIIDKAKGKYYYTKSDTRYKYNVKEKSFNATFFAKADKKFPDSSEKIELRKGDIESRITEVNEDVERYNHMFWFFYLLIIFGFDITIIASTERYK